MALYKYVAPDRIDILQHGLISITAVSRLNDAFEMSPYFHTVFDQRETRDLIEKIILQPDSDLSNEASSLREVINNLKAEANLTLEQAINAVTTHLKQLNIELVSHMSQLVRTEVVDKFGVLCLTDRPNNALMWGHYAKGHLGFVIEFDEKHSFFNGKSIDSNIPYLHKIKYSKRKPYRNKMSDLTPTEMFFTKSKDWQYEHEWRIMFPLKEAKDIIDHPQIGKLYRFEIPPECIKGIILGCKMSPEGIMNLKKNDSRYASIKLSKAQMNDRTYNLDIIKL